MEELSGAGMMGMIPPWSFTNKAMSTGGDLVPIWQLSIKPTISSNTQILFPTYLNFFNLSYFVLTIQARSTTLQALHQWSAPSDIRGITFIFTYQSIFFALHVLCILQEGILNIFQRYGNPISACKTRNNFNEPIAFVEFASQR